MTALEQVNAYSARLTKTLRAFTATRGLAITASVALLLTTVAVWVANQFAFAHAVTLPLRICLYLGVLAVVILLLYRPLVRLTRHQAVRQVEGAVPAFHQRLLTLTERPDTANPFTEILAEEALQTAAVHPASFFAPVRQFWLLGSAFAVAAGLLLWMIVAAPGYWGFGASLLWTGKGRMLARPLYEVAVHPGNKTVRRRSDQVITAETLGFAPHSVAIHARYRSGTRWEQTEMHAQPGSTARQFVFAGLPEPVEYYVTAGPLSSAHFTLSVRDLPAIKQLAVKIHYPDKLQLQEVTNLDSGDVRAPAGSHATVSVRTDGPLEGGVLVIDGKRKARLSRSAGGWSSGEFEVVKDGAYHVAVIDGNDEIRMSDDYFIEAKPDEAPVVKITHPGRDPHVSPIEELPLEVDASDDFGLSGLALHYSLNGGAEKTLPLSLAHGLKQANGKTTLAFEDLKAVPGDLVSLYATAQDANQTSRSDIVIAQADPFDLAFKQSQQSADKGGGNPGGENNDISQREKEIIAATFNELKKPVPDKSGDDARFLSDLQGKLGQQAKTLADRMRNRELTSADDKMGAFSKSMDQAAAEMTTAVDSLKSGKWQDSLSPEQKALASLLRAESMFRDIQVAQSRGGGGGGGQDAGRDLARMFDLELDKNKNQYETGDSGAQPAGEQQKAMDNALERLRQLAQRQQELAENHTQSAMEQRWEEERLRREAEELRRQLEQQSQNGQSSGSQSSADKSQNSQSLAAARSALRQAEEQMRRASSNQDRNAAASAQKNIQQAAEALGNMQRRRSDDTLSDLAAQSEALARQQKETERKMADTFSVPRRSTGQRGEQIASEKERMAEQLERLQQQMSDQARAMSGQQPNASSKLGEALSEAQQNELALRMKKGAEWIREGYGFQTGMREPVLTAGLDQLSRKIAEARQAAAAEGGDQAQKQAAGDSKAKALSDLQALRQKLEQSTGTPQQQKGGQPQSGGGTAAVQQGMESLQNLQRQIGRGDRQLNNEIGQALASLGTLNGASADELAARLNGEVLPNIDRLEFDLQRRLADKSDAAHSGTPENPPAQYRDAVADYFRRLSH